MALSNFALASNLQYLRQLEKFASSPETAAHFKQRGDALAAEIARRQSTSQDVDAAAENYNPRASFEATP